MIELIFLSVFLFIMIMCYDLLQQSFNDLDEEYKKLQIRYEELCEDFTNFQLKHFDCKINTNVLKVNKSCESF